MKALDFDVEQYELELRTFREKEIEMKYILLKKMPRVYFKEYQGNKPIWTANPLEASIYDWENAWRIRLRLACQSQVVELVKVKDDLTTRAWNNA